MGGHTPIDRTWFASCGTYLRRFYFVQGLNEVLFRRPTVTSRAFLKSTARTAWPCLPGENHSPTPGAGPRGRREPGEGRDRYRWCGRLGFALYLCNRLNHGSPPSSLKAAGWNRGAVVAAPAVRLHARLRSAALATTRGGAGSPAEGWRPLRRFFGMTTATLRRLSQHDSGRIAETHPRACQPAFTLTTT